MDVQVQVSSLTPAWIKYLVGAFPQTRLGELTVAVLQSHYEETDPAVMMAAAKAYVAEQEWWPSVAALRPFVANAQRSVEAAEAGQPLDWRDMQAYKASSPYWQLCTDGCGEYRHHTWPACPFCAELEGAGS